MVFMTDGKTDGRTAKLPLNFLKFETLSCNFKLMEIEVQHTVQPLNNTPHYNTNLDKIRSCCGSKICYHGTIRSNYSKITIK